MNSQMTSDWLSSGLQRTVVTIITLISWHARQKQQALVQPEVQISFHSKTKLNLLNVAVGLLL